MHNTLRNNLSNKILFFILVINGVSVNSFRKIWVFGMVFVLLAENKRNEQTKQTIYDKSIFAESI